jgi:hypothetical protein
MEPPPDLAEEFRNWLELPRGVTASILLRLGAIQILTSVQMVCSPWRNLCKDPSLWRTVDMRNNGEGLIYNLEKMCHHAVDRSLRPVGRYRRRVLWHQQAPQAHS